MIQEGRADIQMSRAEYIVDLELGIRAPLPCVVVHQFVFLCICLLYYVYTGLPRATLFGL